MADFEELVHRYEARIFRFVANDFQNPADAQEVVQETFVAAFLNLGKFDARRSFATWLFTIARRKCIDRHRAARPSVEGEIPELPDMQDPSSLLAEREAEQQVWETARQALPELQFQTLWLKYSEEMSVKEIARVLRRTQIHVKVLLFRARTRLAMALESVRANEQLGGTSCRPSRLCERTDQPEIGVTPPSELDGPCGRLLSPNI